MRKWFYAGFMLAGAIMLTACNVDQSASALQGQGQQQAAAPQGTPVAGAAQSSQGGGPNGGPGAFPTMDPTAAAAFQDLNRLAVGMLYLQDTNTHPLTKDQAAKLLPLWQDVQTAMQPPQNQDQTPGAGNGSQGGGFARGGGRFFADAAKIETDVTGIQAVLTADQTSDLNALTQDQMTATLKQHNINGGFGFAGGGPGFGGGQGGNGGPQGAFSGTPGAFATARAEGTLPAPRTQNPDAQATGQARRAQGDPLIAAVVTMLQTLAGS